MTIKANKNQIVTILETLVGSGQPLEAVYGYIKKSLTKYPTAMVEYAGGGGSDLRFDSANNMLKQPFTIWVVFEESTSEVMENYVLDTLDSVLDAFRTTIYADNLNGSTDIFTIENIDKTHFSEPVPLVAWKIDVTCQDLKPLT